MFEQDLEQNGYQTDTDVLDPVLSGEIEFVSDPNLDKETESEERKRLRRPRKLTNFGRVLRDISNTYRLNFIDLQRRGIFSITDYQALSRMTRGIEVIASMSEKRKERYVEMIIEGIWNDLESRNAKVSITLRERLRERLENALGQDVCYSQNIPHLLQIGETLTQITQLDPLSLSLALDDPNFDRESLKRLFIEE